MQKIVGEVALRQTIKKLLEEYVLTGTENAPRDTGEEDKDWFARFFQRSAKTRGAVSKSRIETIFPVGTDSMTVFRANHKPPDVCAADY